MICTAYSAIGSASVLRVEFGMDRIGEAGRMVACARSLVLSFAGAARDAREAECAHGQSDTAVGR